MTVHEIHERLLQALRRFVAIGEPGQVAAAKAMCRAAGISEEEVRWTVDAELGARR